ncbi:MAG: phosphatase PAP2 family protein [Saprospiraceae bacterium]|nr:phosphatase PAP2 family protein [Lewinella sp.]
MNIESNPASWKNIWRDNRMYFIAFIIFWLIAFGIYLGITQGDDILFFNRRRTALGDTFFRYGTHMGEEIAYIFVGVILIFYSYRNLIMIPIIGVVVTAVSALLKEIFRHPRPFRWFQENGMDGLLQTIEGVTINMGSNSFPSGHTMSAFTLYTFLALCLPRKKINSVILIALPIMVGVSRIYLIKHFLEDVLVGALVGVILGVLLYKLQYVLFKYPHPWMDGHLKLIRRTKVKEIIEEVQPDPDREKSH